MKNKNENNRHANKMLFLILLIGVTPMLIIFTLYLQDKTSPLLNFIYDTTKNIPSITSKFNPMMTKAMDVYGKSAPMLGLITFLIVLRKRVQNTITDRSTLIKSCVLSPFIYIFYVYFFLLTDIEMTTAGRPIRFMSDNNFTLLIFYISLYYASFLLTYIMCYLPLMAYKLWKERQ